jgi:hypothetical protein
MRPERFWLEAGQAEDAWREQRPDFLGRVVGPQHLALKGAGLPVGAPQGYSWGFQRRTSRNAG